VGFAKSACFIGSQGDEFPAEVACGGALTHNFGGTLVDVDGILYGGPDTGHGFGKTFQASADFGDGALTLLLANFLVGAAEDKDDRHGMISPVSDR